MGKDMTDSSMVETALALGAVISKPDKYSIKNGATILATEYPDPVWIVPGLLPSGFTILAGRPKIGKSWLALQIAQAVATGGKMFDKTVEQGRVLYLALEDNEIRLQKRMQKQGWTQEAASQVDFLTMDVFRHKIGPLHKDGSAKLYDLLEAGNYRLVEIDPLNRVFIGLKDINDNQQVTAALSPLQEMSITTNHAMLVVDHHNKPRGIDPNPIDDILGSTAKSAVLDTALGLYRDKDHKGLRLLCEGRDTEPLDLTLQFDNMTGCWQSRGNTAALVDGERDQEIIDYLSNISNGCVAEIAKGISQPESHTSTRCKKLQDKGILSSVRNGHKIIYTLMEV